MGFTRFEAAHLLVCELAVLTLLPLPLGWAIGYGMAWLLSSSFESELFRIPLIVDLATYGAASR
jgi:putative ABC transport system permease protein